LRSGWDCFLYQRMAPAGAPAQALAGETMRIEAVETQLVRLPLRDAWRDAIQDVTHIELVVTDVTTATGLVGTGFAYTGGVGGRTLKAMLEHDIAPVLGRPAAPRGLWHQCWHHLHNLGGGGVTLGLSRFRRAKKNVRGE
jgi:L-alanine-DL-glutamate epimerase-like enolase superfamily enzyme